LNFEPNIISTTASNKIKQYKFTRKRRKFKAVLIFEETAAMRIQALELKK
jgi:hypothetical protein